jgi:anti-anti-sigma factor
LVFVSAAHLEGRSSVMAVSGQLDASNAGVASERLGELVQAGGDILIDVSGLRSVDSTALMVIVAAVDPALERGRTVTFRHPTHDVARALALTGLDGVFRVEP